MFVGRREELAILKEAYASKKSEFVVIYGRRRIGKSSLIYKFAEGKPEILAFEALEGERKKAQIKHFTESLRRQTSDTVLSHVNFAKWQEVFSYLTDRVISRSSRKGKLILFFDEVQWMAAGRSNLISLLKYYWDNQWKQKNVMLILCGSIAAFMVRKVIRSKALYGRITAEILLKGLRPDEAALLFKKRRSTEEILKYLLVFGGVPKYLEEVNLNRSFNQNMNRLCFSRSGHMTHEVERIFYSQFRESQTYLRIVSLLKDRLSSFDQISKKLKMSSGGGLKLYLKNLEDAEIVRSYVPFSRGVRSKFRKYTLADEYLLFYFKYVEPNLRTIQESNSRRLFETLTRESLDTWLGFAFERFCIKHAAYISRRMGFEDEMLVASPYFEKGDERFQIDLIYKRSDKVITVCEIKHRNVQVTTKVIPEVERKISRLKIPRGYSCEKALISVYGPNQALRDSGYFDHALTLDDILGISTSCGSY
jgi:AAA+ ATPase superfamily predicted ATPase